MHPGHKLLSNGRQREFSILKGPEGLDYLFDLYNLSVQKKKTAKLALMLNSYDKWDNGKIQEFWWFHMCIPSRPSNFI